ncbi:hypothetical protein Vsou_16050 [Vulcanisaeta souniana JCM 11219]|uniref:Uncharacterized protein n=2 Tax=Vulcanisaeta souniana JCM 11219 TaxID=1293586 RepID=A0ABM8BND5_9CREN|nr:hypothetical protein Vsou_16050 [Vulcanisaeta souniana JCM 11219]
MQMISAVIASLIISVVIVTLLLIPRIGPPINNDNNYPKYKTAGCTSTKLPNNPTIYIVDRGKIIEEIINIVANPSQLKRITPGQVASLPSNNAMMIEWDLVKPYCY